MPKSAKQPKTRSCDPYRKRTCKLCKLPFVPTTKIVRNADRQEFCCDNHRKEFWQRGSLPFAKLLHRIEKRTREIAREEIAAQNTIEVCRELIGNMEARMLKIECRLVGEKVPLDLETELQRVAGLSKTQSN